MALFDEYVMVDWSSVNHPKTGPDSVWIGVGDAETVAVANPRTRAEAREHVHRLLREAHAAGRRILVGFDFPYGYPRGFARALGLPPGPPWLRVWEVLAETIADDARNVSNRFVAASGLNERLGPEPGPFWMRPEGTGTAALPPKQPSFPYGDLEEHRETELALKRRRRHPQPVWKLYGQGSVGSQALVGIPAVYALRFDSELASWSRVWPFETGFVPAPVSERGPFVVHAEIWPGVVDVKPGRGEILDAAQVRTLVGYFAGLDRDDGLGALFAAPGDAPAGLEEGWILGA